MVNEIIKNNKLTDDQFKQYDESKYPGRLERRKEIEPIILDGGKNISPYAGSLYEEAGEAFVAGLYRSSIFCSVTLVDQILRHTLVKIASDKYKAQQLFMDRKHVITFGNLIEKYANKIPKFEEIREDCKFLNKIRNYVAVHSTFVDWPENTDLSEKIRSNETMINHLNELLEIVKNFDPAFYKQLLQYEIRSRTNSTDDNISVETLHSAMQKKDSQSMNFIWQMLQIDIQKEIAKETFKIMQRIMLFFYALTDSEKE